MSRIKQKFSSLSFTSLFVEMVIVFMGVYLAFLLSNYQENRKVERESARVVALMQVGLDHYEGLFEGFAQLHETENAAFRDELNNGRIPEFWNRSYFPAPQYPIDVINFVLTKESYKVFAIDVYLPLTRFSNAMQRVMYVEEKLVTLGERYEPLPDQNDPQYERVAKQQRILAEKYWRYLEIRKAISKEIVATVRALKKELNALELRQ